MPLITLFSAPKPFTDPHIATIQHNAIDSWKALGEDVEVLLLGEEAGLQQAAAELGVRHIPELERNADGTPLISSMFSRAAMHGRGELMMIINADIILMPDILAAARCALDTGENFLLMGRRYDMDVTAGIQFTEGWQARLQSEVEAKGELHKAKGSDYFIFRRDAFPAFPPFAIGRAGWDNWTIYHARKQGWLVVECSEAVMVVHQQHDYHHLPGGKIHYTLPESDENLRIAGGKRHIFTLQDANYRMDSRLRIVKMGFSPVRCLREFEILPVLRWDRPQINDLFFYLANPKKFIRHKFPRLAKTLGIKGKADE